MKLTDFKPGDMLELTFTNLQGTEVRSAIVNYVDFNKCGHVTFGPRYVERLMHAGQGTFNPEKVGTTPFGMVDVKIVGHKPFIQQRQWQPRPGDTGYDLMC